MVAYGGEIVSHSCMQQARAKAAGLLGILSLMRTLCSINLHRGKRIGFNEVQMQLLM